MAALFPGFDEVVVHVDGLPVHARVGGAGPPVLLLHGYPQTSAMWHAVAPALARTRTVVAADLRGYGRSGTPEGGPAAYAKRAMAADQVGLMAHLGFDRFAAVGHDRGARVVHRMCLDAPAAVERAAVLDVAPTRHVFGHVDRDLATTYFHWFFLAQAPDLPERMIGADPAAWLRGCLDRWSGAHAFDERALAEYVRCFTPETVAATCDDYRAAAGVDLEHDDADAAAGHRVTCPLLVLWGGRGLVGRSGDVLATWRGYADDVRGAALDCGHFLPEERPEQTLRHLEGFLAHSAP